MLRISICVPEELRTLWLLQTSQEQPEAVRCAWPSKVLCGTKDAWLVVCGT